MSNPYVNQILYGRSSREITKQYVDGLLPNMLTVEWIHANTKDVRPARVESSTSTLQEYVSVAPTATGAHNVKDSISQAISTMQPGRNEGPQKKASASATVEPDPEVARPAETKANPRNRISGKTLFWAIYSAENPKEAFLRPSAKNVEIETRMQIVDRLKMTPKRLKETSAKLTMEQTQALFGAMLTAREDRLDFCVAYSVYYNKHILIVYEKTYRLFSPTFDTTIEDDDHVIILRAIPAAAASRNGAGKTNYVFDPEDANPKATAESILRTHLPPLRAQSNYKTPELESMAAKMGIPTKSETDGKRRKKEDMYNDLRVVIHNDMEFVQGQSWNKN
jgi:hypothetical protein